MTVLYLQREQVLHAAPPRFYSYRSPEGTNQTATFFSGYRRGGGGDRGVQLDMNDEFATSLLGAFKDKMIRKMFWMEKVFVEGE